MLVTLMITRANAQNSPFSLAAQYSTESFKQENSLFSLDVTQTKDEEEYEKNLGITRRSRYKSRHRSERWDIDKYFPRRGTDNFVNVYLGLNNYLLDDELPNSNSPLSLNPITSYYAGLNFDKVTHLLGPLYLDWGAGVSIQSFSFENTRTRILKGDNEIIFGEVTGITGRRSRLNVSHLNVHFVPTFSFGRYGAFRVGFGVFGGYRIGSNTRVKFDDADGNKQKDRIRDSFFVNPYKYGLRATIGWDSFDLFFNYEVSELFEEDIQAPRLNPMTFGVIL